MNKETSELKLELFRLLNMIKNMEAGMDGEIHDAIYLRYKDKPYAIHLVELEDAQVTDTDREKYLNCDDRHIKDMKNIESMKYFID